MGGNGQDEELERLAQEALALFREGSKKRLSTSSVGRALRLSTLAARTATGLTTRRLRRMISNDETLLRLAQGKAAKRAVRELGEMKGVAMKIGQMLSYVDHTVPAEYRHLLALLQTQSPATPFEQVASTIESELGGPIEQHFSEFDETPLATASIGQVHRARTISGDEVAVKVQHPRIEEAMAADLKSATIVGRLKGLLLPRADMKGLTRELRTRLMEECDYELEAVRQARFAEIFAAHPTIVVPRVYEALSARRVLVSEFSPGRTFPQWLASNPSQAARDRIGTALCRFYIGTLYLEGLFNADPHPGNYLFLDDGRIVMVDYGCVRAFDPPFVDKLVALLRSVVEDDREAMHQASVDLGIVKPNVKYDREASRELLRYLYALLLEDRPVRVTAEYTSQTVPRFLKSPNLFKMTIPGEMLFLNRVNFGLLSIFVDIGAEVNWRQLTMAFIDGSDPTLSVAPGA